MSSTNIHLQNIEIPYLQAIYDRAKAVGITLELSDFPTLIHQALNDRGEPSFNDMIQTKLLALPQYANVVALGLNRNKTLAMIDLPDYSPIKEYIVSTNLVDHQYPWQLQYGSLQIVNDVVSANGS